MRGARFGTIGSGDAFETLLTLALSPRRGEREFRGDASLAQDLLFAYTPSNSTFQLFPPSADDSQS